MNPLNSNGSRLLHHGPRASPFYSSVLPYLVKSCLRCMFQSSTSQSPPACVEKARVPIITLNHTVSKLNSSLKLCPRVNRLGIAHVYLAEFATTQCRKLSTGPCESLPSVRSSLWKVYPLYPYSPASEYLRKLRRGRGSEKGF